MSRLSQTLLLCLILVSGNAISQSPASYEFYSRSNGGLCSSSIQLFPDSTYCYEEGCERSSRFSLGKWKIEKDWIIFTPTDPTTLKLIDSVTREQTDRKEMEVMIFDRDGKNITNFIAVGQYLQGKWYYPMKIDSSKIVRKDIIHNNCTLIIPLLKRAFRQDLQIDPQNFNLIRIYLNISNDWNFHSNSTADTREPFKLKKKKDKLYSENAATVFMLERRIPNKDDADY